jgi:predicted murein hydrolase (TIGR00659 family)
MNDAFAVLQSMAVPIVWLAISVIAYIFSLTIFRSLGSRAIFHPLLLCVGLVLLILLLFDVPIQVYQQHVVILDWLLGPATVALAVPLYKQLSNLRTHGLSTLFPIMFGGLIAPITAVLVLFLGDFELGIKLTMLSKSITTPLAMDTSEMIGGYPSLAAIIVIFTGVIGAACGPALFRLFSIKSDEAKGLALGTIAHAVGTAQAFHISEKAGAYSTLALCINGVITAIILPILFFLFQLI